MPNIALSAVAHRDVKGRFAPSPTGRMHLGNVWAAVLSWLSVKKAGGRWLLRIEDLDRQRCRPEYVLQLEEDLRWLGLQWDEGGTEGIGQHPVDTRSTTGAYCQSQRGNIYMSAYDALDARGVLYRCSCKRADLHSASAPHASDGRVIYGGYCRPSDRPPFPAVGHSVGSAVRLFVPTAKISFDDRFCGPKTYDLAAECGDFVIRRADGNWGYQLAVVVDDALMGVTEVVRGNDLLLSAAQQIYLYGLLGYKVPGFAHVPLLVNADGQRLSKRDKSLDMGVLRERFTPAELLGIIARVAGWQTASQPLTLSQLLGLYDPGTLVGRGEIVVDRDI